MALKALPDGIVRRKVLEEFSFSVSSDGFTRREACVDVKWSAEESLIRRHITPATRLGLTVH